MPDDPRLSAKEREVIESALRRSLRADIADHHIGRLQALTEENQRLRGDLGTERETSKEFSEIMGSIEERLGDICSDNHEWNCICGIGNLRVQRDELARALGVFAKYAEQQESDFRIGGDIDGLPWKSVAAARHYLTEGQPKEGVSDGE